MRRKAKDYRPISSNAIKIDLPNTTQVTTWSCGASTLVSLCAYYGVGPEDEWDVEIDMGSTRAGADPSHIITAAVNYGLEVEVKCEMTLELRSSSDTSTVAIP